MEFISYLVVFILGFVVGEYVLAYKLKHILEDYIEEEHEVGDEVFKLKTEKHNDILFLYDNTNNFVCQGACLEELARMAVLNKNIKYASVIHDEKIYMFIDGSVKQAL
jgi:hypothetical protein